MKRLFIVANWKSNKTLLEAKSWIQELESGIRNPFGPSSGRGQESGVQNKEIIVCPPVTLLSDLRSYILNHKSSVKLGAQDISPFDEGAYTGEVNGKQIKEFAQYVLIGHSERRKNFHETQEILEKKVQMAKKFDLTPIFCVQDESTQVPNGVEIVAYEPIFAIGSGNPDTPENAEEVAKSIKAASSVQSVLYGGSVTPSNVNSFTAKSSIDGVLVGGASLDAKEFFEIVKNA